MTIESAKQKIRELLEPRGFEEQNMKPLLFINNTGASKIGVDMFGCANPKDKPIVGVFINNKLEEEGHGLKAVDALRNQVIAIWDKEIGKEQPVPKPEPNPISDNDAIIGAIHQCLDQGAKKIEEIKVVTMYWCGGDETQARRIQSQVIAGLSINKPTPKPEPPVKDEPKNQPKTPEVVAPEHKGEVKKMEPKKEEKGLVTQENAKPPAIKKPMTDAERDNQIELAKARRFLEERGTSYKVQGKERPDAHKIQQVANERAISIEIISAVQTDAYSDIIVRGHLGEQYVDACVHHDFPTEYLLKTMEIIKKNPEILDHYEGTSPVIKEGSKIRDGDRDVDAKYYLIHALLSFKKFSLRDARTKAASIAEAMLLNRDWRDEDEVQSEISEKVLVEESIKNKG